MGDNLKIASNVHGFESYWAENHKNKYPLSVVWNNDGHKTELPILFFILFTAHRVAICTCTGARTSPVSVFGTTIHLQYLPRPRFERVLERCLCDLFLFSYSIVPFGRSRLCKRAVLETPYGNMSWTSIAWIGIFQ